MGVSPFLVSMCQNVQPLQACAPCAKAPIRCLEPTLSPKTEHHRRAPALVFFLLDQPKLRLLLKDLLLSMLKRERAGLRVRSLNTQGLIGSCLAAFTRADAAVMYSFSRSMPIKLRPNCFATLAVVPEPKNGSRMTSPGLLADNIMRANSASGFCVGCEAFCQLDLSKRSSPCRWEIANLILLEYLRFRLSGLHKLKCSPWRFDRARPKSAFHAHFGNGGREN